MKHEHKQCEHAEIALCKTCDVVFCKNQSCNKEWGNQNTTYTFSQPSITDFPVTLCAGSGTTDLTNSHKHY